MFEDTCIIFCSLVLELPLILILFCIFFYILHGSNFRQAGGFTYCIIYSVSFYRGLVCHLLNSFLLYKRPYKTLIFFKKMLNSFNHRQHSQGFLGQFPWDIFGQVTLLFWQFCISFGPGLVYSFKMSGCNISNMRLSVSSPKKNREES